MDILITSLTGASKLATAYWFNCNGCLLSFIKLDHISAFAIHYALWGVLLYVAVALLGRLIAPAEDAPEQRLSFMLIWLLPLCVVTLLGMAALLELAFWILNSREKYQLGPVQTTINGFLIFSAVTAPVTALQELAKHVKRAAPESRIRKVIFALVSLACTYAYIVAYLDVMAVLHEAPKSAILWASLLPLALVLILALPLVFLFMRKLRKVKSLLRI